jgi:hypothetical protein
MTPDYTKVASYDVRSFLWSQLQSSGLFNAATYTADGFTTPLIPILPAQQVPEFNNLLPGKTYIIYDVAQSHARNTNFWMFEESMTFEITSRNPTEIQTIVNFFIDLFRRYEKSATDINVTLVAGSKFNFLWFAVDSADPVQSFQNEGGFMNGVVTIRYAYTREIDGGTGRYL